MQNYVQPGAVITVTAPSGGTTSGVGVLIGSLFGVAADTVAAGASVELAVEGVYDLAKDNSTFTEGELVYWNASASQVTSASNSGANKLIGIASLNTASGTNALGGGSGDATCRVRLNGAFIS